MKSKKVGLELSAAPAPLITSAGSRPMNSHAKDATILQDRGILPLFEV